MYVLGNQLCKIEADKASLDVNSYSVDVPAECVKVGNASRTPARARVRECMRVLVSVLNVCTRICAFMRVGLNVSSA